MASTFIRTNSEVWSNKTEEQKNLYKDSIVFIEDSKLMWSNGVYYCINNASDITYYNESINYNINNVEEALNKLFNKVYWTKLALNSFNILPNINTYEVGDTEDITLTWKWNKTPTRETINDEVASSGYIERINSNSATTITFNLKGYDNDAEGDEYSVSGSKTITFKYKMFIYEGDISSIDINSAKYSKWCETQTIGDGSTTVLTGTIISICVPNDKTVQFTNDNTGEVMNISQKIIENSTDNTINYICGSATTKYKIMQIKVDRTLITTKVTIKIS